MPGIHVLHVPLPRAVVGVPRGGRRQAEAHGVVDECPLAVRSVTDAEAPVGLRKAWNRYETSKEPFRFLDGRAYRPLAWHLPRNAVPTEGMPPEELPARLLALVRNKIGLRSEAAYVDGDQLAHWKPWLDGIGGNGLVPAAEKPFRDVSDDGRPRQAALAAALSDHLLSVDGLLYVRAPLPLVCVRAWRVTDKAGVSAEEQDGRWDHENGERPAWNGFPPHREDDIAAYGAHLAVALDTTFSRDASSYEILDRDLLESAYGWGPERRAKAAASSLAASAGRVLASLDDAGIRAWMSLRSAAGGDGFPDPAAVLSDVATLAESARPGVTDLVSWQAGEMGMLAAEARQARCLAAFMEARELGLDAEDDLSLAGLVPN